MKSDGDDYYKLSREQLDKLDRIDDLRREGNYEEALSICNEMIASNADIFIPYMKRKNLYHRMGRYEEAFQDIDFLLKLQPEKSAASYYSRGEMKMEIGSYQDALHDFTLVINMKEYYFLNASYFFRSLAYYKLRKKKESLNDCLQLPHDFSYGTKVLGEAWRVYTKDSLREMITKMR